MPGGGGGGPFRLAFTVFMLARVVVTINAAFVPFLGSSYMKLGEKHLAEQLPKERRKRTRN